MTLIEFLLARIAEDEAAACQATAGTWTYADGGDVWAGDQPVTLCGFDSAGSLQESIEPWNAEHIVRHDPARVLAECAAKRRIVNAYQLAEADLERSSGYPRRGGKAALSAACSAFRYAAMALAVPYADHPDYDETWRP